MSKAIDELGNRYGRLTVVARAEKGKRPDALWECKCDCGALTIVTGVQLRRRQVQSCGCLVSDRMTGMNTSHGMSKHPAYHSFCGAFARCSNRKSKDFHGYGARGVRFLFTSFEQFWAEMGPSWFEGASLDRKDNEGNYEPGNCRWATATEQGRNKRNNVRVEFEGEMLTLGECAERLGVKFRTLQGRYYRYGQDPEKLFAPLMNFSDASKVRWDNREEKLK